MARLARVALRRAEGGDLPVPLPHFLPEPDGKTLAERLGAELIRGAVAKDDELRPLAVETVQDLILAGVIEHAGKQQMLTQRIAQPGDEVEEPALGEGDDRVARARRPSEIVQGSGDRSLFLAPQPQGAGAGLEADDALVGVGLVQLIEEEPAQEQQEKSQTAAKGGGSGQPGRQHVETQNGGRGHRARHGEGGEGAHVRSQVEFEQDPGGHDGGQ